MARERETTENETNCGTMADIDKVTGTHNYPFVVIFHKYFAVFGLTTRI